MTATGKVRVLIADDQAIIREALAALIRLEPDIDVIGLAGDAGDVMALAAEHEPDVVLMDVQMPGDDAVKDGIEATARIVARRPATRVIILTTFGRPGYLRRAMEAGAVGFMVKDAPADRLVDGIRRVASGLRVVDPTLAADSLSIGASPLTEREAEVLTAAARGGSTAVIAAAVFLSEGTVRNHLSSAMGKLGAGSRAEAVRIATDNGWLG
jgi:two-component system, NarL family, response regulator DesR